MPTNNGGRRAVTPMVVTGSSLPLSFSLFRPSVMRERVTGVTAANVEMKCESRYWNQNNRKHIRE